MNIVLLTSSRADYGIYLPLLRRLEGDDFFNLSIVAFGTHLSEKHGYTLNQILADGFKVVHTVETLPSGDLPADIASAIGLTTLKFAELWAALHRHTHLIICLGDRYEMFAAVCASVPFNLPVAHFYGGETTEGAIDNKFRHAITQMAAYHFTATETYAQKVAAMTGSTQHVYSVGSLSLDNLLSLPLLDANAFFARYGINLHKSTILVTFHPETVQPEQNIFYTQELIKTLTAASALYQVVITMPNADTMGNIVRTQLLAFAQTQPDRVFAVENFGTQGYFSCMNLVTFLLGNTSSGIIEAASFGKYVINIGNRQQGRACSNNVLHTPINTQSMLAAIDAVEKLPPFTGINIYRQQNVAERVISILKTLFTNNTPLPH
ncbi:MAG TPA: UDP-N-acetylglucosamine 2-epimerase [Chitinophagales bacterium]|nr:UDP-N-acetylglucosamine 2-epimerase [Chitinophagales bacterium]HRK27713.1 UDP-N-acetylglucosamine 2-epimerase [Chitinophagales bacterium]